MAKHKTTLKSVYTRYTLNRNVCGIISANSDSDTYARGESTEVILLVPMTFETIKFLRLLVLVCIEIQMDHGLDTKTIDSHENSIANPKKNFEKTSRYRVHSIFGIMYPINPIPDRTSSVSQQTQRDV